MMEDIDVIRAMRKAVKDQVTDFVDKNAFNFARDNGLIRVTMWPCFVISITDKGRRYIYNSETI